MGGGGNKIPKCCVRHRWMVPSSLVPLHVGHGDEGRRRLVLPAGMALPIGVLGAGEGEEEQRQVLGHHRLPAALRGHVAVEGDPAHVVVREGPNILEGNFVA